MFCITGVVIPDGVVRVGAVACLSDAGLYTTEGNLVYGMDGPDSRNERMLIKAAGAPRRVEPQIQSSGAVTVSRSLVAV